MEINLSYSFLVILSTASFETLFFPFFFALPYKFSRLFSSSISLAVAFKPYGIASFGKSLTSSEYSNIDSKANLLQNTFSLLSPKRFGQNSTFVSTESSPLTREWPPNTPLFFSSFTSLFVFLPLVLIGPDFLDVTSKSKPTISRTTDGENNAKEKKTITSSIKKRSKKSFARDETRRSFSKNPLQ